MSDSIIGWEFKLGLVGEVTILSSLEESNSRPNMR